jgi:hypothetical protein
MNDQWSGKSLRAMNLVKAPIDVRSSTKLAVSPAARVSLHVEGSAGAVPVDALRDDALLDDTLLDDAVPVD